MQNVNAPPGTKNVNVMFILKRQDVEISTIQHPKRDQQVVILHYQGQTFRLISVFNADQEEEAKGLWRELTDHRGKACVLLEESDRYSIWGKIRLEQLSNEEPLDANRVKTLTIATIVLLQAVYVDIQDLLGTRQAGSFHKDITDLLTSRQFPQTKSAEAVTYLLKMQPTTATKIPAWEENHLVIFLQELHRLGKAYFGNTDFAQQVTNTLVDLPEEERSHFINWLHKSPLSKLWY